MKLLLLITLFIPAFANSQNLQLFTSESFVKNGQTLPYRILYPENFSKKEKYPLLLVLHGAGERGNDNELQLTHGASLFMKDDIRKKFPGIVVFPQCPMDSYWSNVNIEEQDERRTFTFRESGEPTKAMSLLSSLIDDLMKHSYIDKQRIYIGGLSMGGMGTFEILSRKPDVFAAAFVICGSGHPKTVKEYATKVPVWIFHGGKDDVVPLSFSKIMVTALKEAGANPRFTMYPDVEHDSWTQVFAEPDLLPWLFSNRRK
jgi:predicted peptidase